tara:strand:- start:329 stop:841 length:513 start_codon:yes stop_codon:yes gene_type:complete
MAEKKKKKYLMRRSSDARKRDKELQQNPNRYDRRVEIGNSAANPFEMTSTQVNPFTGATKRTFSSLRKRNIVRKNPITSTIYAHGTPPAQEASKLTANRYGYETKKYRAIDDDTPSKKVRERNKKRKQKEIEEAQKETLKRNQRREQNRKMEAYQKSLAKKNALRKKKKK